MVDIRELSEGLKMTCHGRTKLALAMLGLLVAMLASASGAIGANPPPQVTNVTVVPSTPQAGGHPDVNIRLGWVTNTQNCEGRCLTVRTVRTNFPTGFIGNPHVAPKCTLSDFNQGACPSDSQIGVSSAIFEAIPLYNMQTRPDQAGLTAFVVPFINAPVFLELTGRTDSDYGLSAIGSPIPQILDINEVGFELWGVPAADNHNGLRFITPLLGGACGGGPEGCEAEGATGIPAGVPSAPFLQNPTVCDVPLFSTVDVEYYGGLEAHGDAPWPSATGCDQLSFNPSQITKPTTTQADTPSGMDVELNVPQTQSPTTPSPSELRSQSSTLPLGFSINPNGADGKVACSDAQTSIGTLFAATCPEFAKIASLLLDSAALPAPIPGAMYLAEPKPGNPYRVVLTADGFATHIKLMGSVHPDPQTGQLTLTFQDLPQAPLQGIKVHFFGSERGILATPEQCGNFEVQNEFVPWDAALTTREATSFITIDSGPGDSDCPNGVRPFDPRVASGSSNGTAGAHAPFLLALERDDGDQNLGGVDVRTPPGFAASLKGVPYCPESAIAQLTASGYTGVAEQAGSVCPAASQIGTTTTAAGAGSRPIYVEGRVYLAGPYKGGPLSLVVVIPAVSGPYDLGNLAIRSAIYVDPESAKVRTVSDPFPQILEGIPLRARFVQVRLDRPNFALNPTNCDKFSVDTAVLGDEGALVNRSNHFQVSNCGELPFGPRLTLTLRGGVKRRGHPAIHAKLTTGPGEANTRSVSVTLPKGELLDNAHIETVCTRVDFAKDACPQGSLIGQAEAVSPLLDDPLKGAVYLRSSDNKLPDMVIDLRGQIDILLIGRVDSVQGRLRTTFERLPDAGVSSFSLSLLGGSKGLLINSESLCGETKRATVKMTGQNGAVRNSKPKVRTSCRSSARSKRHQKRRNQTRKAVR